MRLPQRNPRIPPGAPFSATEVNLTMPAGELQRSGLIRYHHGQLTVVDRKGLEATACECHRIDHERLIRLL
jgi:hypothetical protein